MKFHATLAFALISISLAPEIAGIALASGKGELPPVRVTGLHTLAHWPSEQFPARVDISDIGPRQAFPADRACVEKQIAQIRQAAATATGATELDEIHITLHYGAGPDKNVQGEVQTSYKYRGPSWTGLKFGEKRVLEVSTTLPNIRKDRDSDRCVVLPGELVRKAIENPGTNFGNLVVGVTSALDDLNSKRLDSPYDGALRQCGISPYSKAMPTPEQKRCLERATREPASSKALSDRREGKPGDSPRGASAPAEGAKSGVAR